MNEMPTNPLLKLTLAWDAERGSLRHVHATIIGSCSFKSHEYRIHLAFVHWYRSRPVSIRYPRLLRVHSTVWHKRVGRTVKLAD